MLELTGEKAVGVDRGNHIDLGDGKMKEFLNDDFSSSVK